MWCANCLHDVPSAARAAGSQAACPICGDKSFQRSPADAAAHARSDDATLTRGGWDPGYDSWEIDLQLEHIGRRLNAMRPLDDTADTSAAPVRMLRFDTPHGQVSAPVQSRGKRQAVVSQPTPGGFVRGLAWGMVSLGTMFFVCGAVLGGWSALTQRVEFWNLGLPFLLGGALAAAVGFLIQIDRLGRENAAIASQLQQMDSLPPSGRRRSARTSLPSPAPTSRGMDHRLAELRRQIDTARV